MSNFRINHANPTYDSTSNPGLNIQDYKAVLNAVEAGLWIAAQIESKSKACDFSKLGDWNMFVRLINS